jgi:hypothetical protein
MDPAIEQIAMNATPEYLAVLKAQGVVPQDWMPPVPAQAPRDMAVIPQAPQMRVAAPAPVDPMAEMRRYFGY